MLVSNNTGAQLAAASAGVSLIKSTLMTMTQDTFEIVLQLRLHRHCNWKLKWHLKKNLVKSPPSNLSYTLPHCFL